MINSSTFLFTAVYGPFLRFSGRTPPLLGFRSHGCRSRYFRMTAPKERRRSRPVKPLAPPARQRINVAPFPERARAINGRENLYRHIKTNSVLPKLAYSNHCQNIFQLFNGRNPLPPFEPTDNQRAARLPSDSRI